jgi:hypothetical protein
VARVLADAVLVLHLLFIVFAALGGLAALRWPRVAWVHLPAVAWAAVAEFTGWICPLTPIEVRLRHQAGQTGFEGGFIEHYLGALIYPAGLTRTHQMALGALLLMVNLIVYWRLFASAHRRRR